MSFVALGGGCARFVPEVGQSRDCSELDQPLLQCQSIVLIYICKLVVIEESNDPGRCEVRPLAGGAHRRRRRTARRGNRRRSAQHH
ncbi:hypothetical protein ACFPRL_19700 [Pseudoclavibacter helvolus]